MRKAQFKPSDLHRAFNVHWSSRIKGAATDLQELGHEIDAAQRKLSNLKFAEVEAREEFEKALKAGQGVVS